MSLALRPPSAHQRLCVLALLACGSVRLAAQAGGPAIGFQRGIALTANTIYISPDTTSSRIGNVQPGMDVAVQAKARDFIQVFAGGVSGWMPDHGVIRLEAPNADEVIFGAAVGLENQAESSGGDRQDALAAAQLYLTIFSDLPSSPRAPEALYRSASVRWQLALSEEPARRTPQERLFPDDTLLRKVIGKFGHTPWAARAQYDLLIEHFTCGDWEDKPSCIGKEVNTYHGYVKKFPHGPDSAEAAYDALYREGIAWTIYSAPGKHHNPGQAAQYARDVARDAAVMQTDYPATDWTAQAALVAFQVAHNTPLKVPGTTPLGGP